MSRKVAKKLKDQANFWQTDLLWHEMQCVFEKLRYAKKLSFPSGIFIEANPKVDVKWQKHQWLLPAALTAQFFHRDVLV